MLIITKGIAFSFIKIWVILQPVNMSTTRWRGSYRVLPVAVDN